MTKPCPECGKIFVLDKFLEEQHNKGYEVYCSDKCRRGSYS